jgi:hypothetical protein
MEVVSSLFLHGADINSFGTNPSSLLTDFAEDVYQSQLHLLRSMGFSDWKVESNRPSLLHAASGAGDLLAVLFALEVAHIDPNTRNGPGILRAPLWYAVLESASNCICFTGERRRG